MKKVILTLLFVIFSLQVFSQWNSNGDNSSVGKLTVNELVVNGKTKLERLTADSLTLGSYTSPNVNLVLFSNPDVNASGNLIFRTSWGTRAMISGIRTNGYRTSLDFYTTLGNNLIKRMRINHDGNVGIGTENPSVKLDVNGVIRSKEVKIEATGWSDFVFDTEYKLPKLQDVEKYINTHKHLEGIPSEKEVKENGIDVAEMQAKLLLKIEELTLYIIDQEKRLKKQEEIIEELRQQAK